MYKNMDKDPKKYLRFPNNVPRTQRIMLEVLIDRDVLDRELFYDVFNSDARTMRMQLHKLRWYLPKGVTIHNVPRKTVYYLKQGDKYKLKRMMVPEWLR